MARYPSTVMASCVLPWDERERLMEDVFREEIRRTIASGFTHVYLFGTAGEGYALDTDRYRQVIGIFHEETRRADVFPMIGVIALSTAIFVERIGIAHDLGFRRFQISFPRWAVLTDPEVLTFFRDVCGAFPDSLFMHYNTAKSGRVLDGTAYRPVIEAVPNLVATKTISRDGAIVSSVVADAPELQHFLAEEMLAAGTLHGECSLLTTFGAMAPQRTWELYRACREGRLDEGARLGRWFSRLGRELFEPLMADPRIDGTYDKLIVRLGGFEEFPTRMLSPYRGVTEQEFQATKALLAERFPDCA